MTTHTAPKILFAAILTGMLAVTTWASIHQSAWQWGGLVTEPDRAWTIATLCDAYAGFLTFYAWVFYKTRGFARAGWFVAIMLLGNIAMSVFVLIELRRLAPGDPVERLLLRRPA
jgi:hypothetical protein